MGIESKIHAIGSLPKILSALVYGRSGTGKTFFGGTFPKPALLIDIREKGTDSISTVEGIDVIQVDTWPELEEVYWYVKQSGKYKSIILDQVSSMQELAMSHAMAEDGKEIMSQRLYGVASGMMKTWLLSFRDLTDQGINVLFIAHDKESKESGDADDDQIDPQVGPRLMPSVAGLLNGAVKVIGNTFVREVFLEDRTRKVEFCMRLGPHAFYTTKMRNPPGTVVPESIVDATYDKIISIMSSGISKPAAGDGEKKAPVRRTVNKE